MSTQLRTMRTPSASSLLAKPVLLEARQHPIRFPDKDYGEAQDHEWCEVHVRGEWRRLRLHDYAEIYKIPGLYEQLFYDILECCSPVRVVDLFAQVLREWPQCATELKVLDLGAGNGMVGEQLRLLGVNTLIGADIIPEAASATDRDRPGLYDDYIVADFCDLDEQVEASLRRRSLNCLTTVAALGFGDIPPRAFATAYNLLTSPGWLAFNIKDSFLNRADSSGFCRLIHEMNDNEIIQIQAYRRYSHRRSISGKRLYYLAMVARKLRDIPQDMLDRFA